MIPDKQKGDVDKASPVVFWDNYGFLSHHSGIDRYANCLASALTAQGMSPVRMIGGAIDSLNTHDLSLGAWLTRLATKAKVAWPNVSFLKLLSSLGTQSKKSIFHGLANTNLPFALGRNSNFSYALTIHDLIPLLPNSGVSMSYKMQFSYMLPRSIDFADLIICVSQWTLDMVLDRFPSVQDKAVLIPHGLVYPDVNKPDVGSLVEHQLLFVSRWEPYKGFEIIGDLLEKLPPSYRMEVVTDGKGEQYLNQHAAPHMLAGRLNVHRSLTDSELQRLYQSSALYVHFSRYEGFALPVWEALCKGTPAMFYKGHACDSLINSGVVLGVDQNCSVDTWVDAIQSWSGRKITAGYQEQLLAYLKKQPTWSHTAEKVKALYNSII